MAYTAPPGADGPHRPLRHRPLVPVLAGFAAGIALDDLMRPLHWFWPALAGVTVLLVVWGVRRGLRPWGNYLLAAILMATVGGAWHDLRCRQLPARHLGRLPLLDGSLYWVEGTVRHEPSAYYRVPFLVAGDEGASMGWHVGIEAESLVGRDEQRLRTAGGVTVFVEGGRPGLVVGDRVRFLGRLRRNRSATNPGQKDRARIYERAGSYMTAHVSRPEALRLLRRPAWYRSPRIALGRLRRLLDRRLDVCLARQGLAGRGGLFKSLLLGRRDALTPSQRRALAESGTLHFLAISGLHVAIFCLFVSGVLAFTNLPVGLRTVLVIGLVWAYVVLTGLRVSGVRAGWMLTFMLAAPLLGRQRDTLSGMAAAALLILLAAPAQLFSPGCQLTFVAVWAIVCIYPQLAVILWPWSDFVGEARQPSQRSLPSDLYFSGRSYLLLSVTVWAATAPLLAFHFNLVSLLAPVLNLLVWPLVLVLLVACFVLVVLLPAGAFLAGAVAVPAVLLSDCIETLVGAASSLPGFGARVPSPSVWWLVVFYAAAVAWVVRHRLRVGRKAFLILALAAAAIYAGSELARRPCRRFTFTVADVGTGQAALLELPGGRPIMFDAGSRIAGRRRDVAEMLRHKRIGRLGTVVVSHLNMDHYGFVPFLTEQFRVDQVVLSSDWSSPAAGRLVEAMGTDGLRLRWVSEESTIEQSGLTCRVLHPDARFMGRPGVTENDRSMVLRVEYEGLSILLTGDIGSAAMRRLCYDHGRDLRADVLILPHHGHWQVALEEFVGLVRPAVAISSGGAEECAEAEEFLKRRGIPVWITGRDGAVIVTMRGGAANVRGHVSDRAMDFRPGAGKDVDD